jgi:hypothetical protein
VQDLLSRMTLEEKVAQLCSKSTLPAAFRDGAFPYPKDGKVDAEAAQRANASCSR